MTLDTTTISGLNNAQAPLIGNERVVMDQGTDTVDASTQQIADLANPAIANAIAAHVAAADPHPGYTTPQEASAAAPVQSVNTRTGAIVLSKNDVSLGNVDNTSDANKPISTAQAAALAGKADLVNGLVPSAQLPGFVDDVLEYASVAAFPGVGEAGKLYVSLATNRIYRWSGSIYVEIAGSPGTTDAVPEGSVNLYFTSARGQTAANAWWSSYASSVGQAVATAASQAAGRTALGLGTASIAATTDFATAAQGAKADTAIQPGNAALSDAREWSAATIDQAEAEAGAATTRRAFTAQRVFQAVAAWWAASSAKTKLDGIAAGATANATDAQLRDRSTHTGTQPASTISGAVTSSGLTMATARLLGRTTASSGAVEEISVSGATLSGGVLTIAGSPGGSSTQLQFNNSGAFGGSSLLTWDGSKLTTAGLTASANAAASMPPVAVTGTWFTSGGTATTTKPQVVIEPAGTTSTSWSTAGTGLGVNAPSGFTGNLADLQINGTRMFAVNAAGDITIRGTSLTTTANTGTFTISTPLQNIAFSVASFTVNSIVNGGDFKTNGVYLGGSTTTLSFDAVGISGGRLGFTAAGELLFGGTGRATSLQPALTADADYVLAQRRGTNAMVFRIYNTFTSDTNYERAKLEWSSSVFRVGTEKGSGGGTARAMELQTDATTRLTIAADGSAITAASGTALVGNHRLTGTAPASATATGTAGDIRYDADYIYVCTATNTWKRSAIATW